MHASRVCSAVISTLMITSGVVLVGHAAVLTLTVLEEFDEFPVMVTLPLPPLLCLAALLTLVGGNLSFVGSVHTCCVRVVPMLWATAAVSLALLLEAVTLVGLFTLIQEDEMDDGLQDVYFNVKLSTSLVLGLVACFQAIGIDFYLYLLAWDCCRCCQSHLCWQSCFQDYEEDMLDVESQLLEEEEMEMEEMEMETGGQGRREEERQEQ